MTPSKFRNQFYLVATSSPQKYILSTGEYVFDSTIDILMIFIWGLLARIAQSLVLLFGKSNDDRNYSLFSVIAYVCRVLSLLLTHFLKLFSIYVFVIFSYSWNINNSCFLTAVLIILITNDVIFDVNIEIKMKLIKEQFQ